MAFPIGLVSAPDDKKEDFLLDATINFERLQSISEGDKEFEQELLQAYVDDSRECLAQIKAAIADSDWEKLIALTHQLKGASGNVGAERMEQLCAEMEQHSRARENTTVYPALLKELEALESFTSSGS